MLCIDVVFVISKRLDFERISKYWKFRNFLKKVLFEKGMHRNMCVSNIGFIWNPSNKARFNVKPYFPLFKEIGSASNIYWKLPYQRVCNLNYQHTWVRSNKALQSWFFSFFFLVFCILLIPCFHFSYFASYETQRKNIWNVSKFASCWVAFFFHVQADVIINREWNFTSLTMRASTCMNWLMGP